MHVNDRDKLTYTNVEMRLEDYFEFIILIDKMESVSAKTVILSYQKQIQLSQKFQSKMYLKKIFMRFRF